MYVTVLRLIWPYVMRYAMGQAADYIQKRREQRLTPIDLERPSDCPPCPPCPPPNLVDADTSETVVTSSNNPIWYALSGLLLGCVFSVMLYVLLQDKDTRL